LSPVAGRITLRPGRRDTPSIVSTRPAALVERLSPGQPVATWPALMAALHALCGHGHRLAASLALQAARGEAAAPDLASRESLRLATVREQLLRIGHDWPRTLTPEQPMPWLDLAGSGLWGGRAGDGERLQGLARWLADAALGEPVERWLAAYDADPAGHTARWAAAGATPLARALAPQAGPLRALVVAPRPLRSAEAFTRPLGTAETGPWCRRRDVGAPAAHNAWMRLVSRLTDLLRLAAPSGEDRLDLGAVAEGPGRGRAWVETARGLLAYRVTLSADGRHVAAAEARAPTDWNFHPQGPLASALAILPPAAHDDARRLAVVFDPCVPFEIAAASAPEPAHA